MTIKVALAGAGAFGIKHLDGIKNIDGCGSRLLISRDLDKTKEVADKYGIPHVTTSWPTAWPCKKWTPSSCARPRKCTPSQSLACLKAGKHVQVEIPLCDVLAEGEDVVRWQKQRAWWPCAATPAASTPATSTCTTRSRRASSTSSKWMCKPTSSAAPT
jgi:2-hydroxy-4-carboxymuconate semialdehyde hemiacetal dehydrogenase